MKKKPAKRRIRYAPGLFRESLTVKELRAMHKKATKENDKLFKEAFIKTMDSHPITYKILAKK